jgi:outer membrane immunogenic protein
MNVSHIRHTLVGVACLISFSSPSLAQASFEGFYGQFGIGHDQNATNNTSVSASSGGSSYTLNSTGSNPHSSHFATAISLGYYAKVDSNFLLGAGVEYEPVIQNTSSYTVASPGQESLNGSYKISNRYTFFISPAITVDKTGLAYAKVGYTGQTLKGNSGFLSNVSFANQSGYALGLGYRQLFASRLYAFIEANYFSYGKSSASGTSGTTTFSVNPSTSAYNGLIGIGYQF